MVSDPDTKPFHTLPLGHLGPLGPLVLTALAGFSFSVQLSGAKQSVTRTSHRHHCHVFSECGLKGSGLKKFSDGATDSG